MNQPPRMVRRRLTAPGPTPLRNETIVNEAGDDSINSDVLDQDGALALVPTNSHTPPPDVEESLSEIDNVDMHRRPGLWTGVAIGLAIVKVMSLFQCCSPYLPSGTIMWPLLILAGADVLLYDFM